MTGPAPSELSRHDFVRVRLLGSGGMGDVWECRPREGLTGFPASVAVKTIRTSLVRRDDVKRRFARECRVLQQLSHPGIARVYAANASCDEPFLVLELLEGETLGQLLEREKTVPLRRAAQIASAVAEALHHAHECGVVHRDVKPSNIHLTPDRVVLTDFGVAALRQSEESLTSTGASLGTAAYSAPEIVGTGIVPPESDVFSLAIVLFECLTGQLPFAGETPIAQAVARVVSAPARLRDVQPDLPLEVDGLVARCLEREASMRPSAAQMADELAAVAGLGVRPSARRARTLTWAVASAVAVTAAVGLVLFAGIGTGGVVSDGAVTLSAAQPVAQLQASGAEQVEEEKVPIRLTLRIVRQSRDTPRALTPVPPSAGSELPPGEFRQGEEITILLESDRAGWVEVFHQSAGSSQVAKLYPERGSAAIRPGDPTELGVFRIDPPAGDDRLLVVFSDLEGLPATDVLADGTVVAKEAKVTAGSPALVTMVADAVFSGRPLVAVFPIRHR